MKLPLTPLQKRVLVLRFVDGLSRTRAATVLKAEGWGRFHGAKAVARVEQRAVDALWAFVRK